jgi:hypothetical protein
MYRNVACQGSNQLCFRLDGSIFRRYFGVVQCGSSRSVSQQHLSTNGAEPSATCTSRNGSCNLTRTVYLVDAELTVERQTVLSESGLG